MRELGRPARGGGIAVVVAALAVLAAAPASAGGGSAGDKAVAAAKARCTLTKIQVRPVKVYRVNEDPYEYRVEGRVRISRPNGALEGCRIKVCEAEELGRGNWYPAWCNDFVVGNGQHRYWSLAPYVDCDEYDGTGWFRSYARFEGSNARALGVETRLCRRGNAVY
jgi:hypothetical protein